MKFYEIIPGRLYQRGRFFEKPLSEKLAVLRSHKIGTVVCLAERCYDEELQMKLGPGYIYWPIADGKKKPALGALIENLALSYRSGDSILVSCNGGRNRSSLVSALLLRRLLGIRGADAAAWVKARRPGAFGSNPYFEQFLKEDRF